MPFSPGPLIWATPRCCGPRFNRYSPDHHVLLWDMHHIITDDWSIQLFFQELAEGYTAFARGQTPELPPLTHTFSDYAWWQAHNTADDAAWWADHLADAQALCLPTDGPRPAVETHRGGNHPISLDGQLGQQVAELAGRLNSSPFMVYLTAFGLVFQRLSGQDDFLVGTTFANRVQPEWERVMGFFINTPAAPRENRGTDRGRCHRRCECHVHRFL